MGRELILFLRRADILKKLTKAAERGTQPVAAITKELLAHFPAVIHDPAVKRKVGFFVSAILDSEGFSVERANVKMKNPLFKSAAVFREASRADDDTAERDCAAVCRVDGRVDGGRGSAARRVPHRKISGPKEARSLTASPAKRTVMSHVTNEQRT
jgi:hypothetical protein